LTGVLKKNIKNILLQMAEGVKRAEKFFSAGGDFVFSDWVQAGEIEWLGNVLKLGGLGTKEIAKPVVFRASGAGDLFG
jgi:hypothetical protein